MKSKKFRKKKTLTLFNVVDNNYKDYVIHNKINIHFLNAAFNCEKQKSSLSKVMLKVNGFLKVN